MWRMLCPKYMCLLAASDPLMLSPAVIFSGGQLLACHVCSEIYPQERSSTCAISCTLCKGVLIFHHVPVTARHMLQPLSPLFTSGGHRSFPVYLGNYYFHRETCSASAVVLLHYYVLRRKKSPFTKMFSTL